MSPAVTAAASPVAEARGYAALADAGLTIEQIAAQAGCRPRRVRERLALLALTEDTLRRVGSGQLPVSAALDALRIAGNGTLPTYQPRRTAPAPRATTAPAPVSQSSGKKRATGRTRPRRAKAAPPLPAPEPPPTPAPAPVPAPAGWFAPEHPLAVRAHHACVVAGHEPGAHACRPCRSRMARAVAESTIPLAGDAARAAISAFLWVRAQTGSTEVTPDDLETFRARISRGPKWLAGILPALLDAGELLPSSEPGRYGLPHHDPRLDAEPAAAATGELGDQDDGDATIEWNGDAVAGLLEQLAADPAATPHRNLAVAR